MIILKVKEAGSSFFVVYFIFFNKLIYPFHLFPNNRLPNTFSSPNNPLASSPQLTKQSP